MTVHPRLLARPTARIATSDTDAIRALVLAPAHETWIRAELAGTGLHTRCVASVAEVVSTLVAAPPPRPQILIIDLAAISAGELLHLHSIRDQGWFGNVIAVGRVPLSVRASLGVARSVAIAPHQLRPIASLMTQHTVHTLRMAKISG